MALDLTLPLLSFTTGKGYAGRLKKLFGDVAIEDPWIPYLCVSSYISRAERAIHRFGPLWRAVRAGSGVQGMFPPVMLDGELHVDGAQILWNKRFAKDAFRATDIGTVLQRASEAVSMANQKLTIRRMADFYMRMPVDRVGMFAIGALGTIEGIGYEHARRTIAEWKSQGRWIGGE